MNYTQNEKINQVRERTIVIGIDIASEVHYGRAFDWRGIEISKVVLRFENSIEGFESLKNWIEMLKVKTSKTEVIVGIEPTGHYWFSIDRYMKENGIKMVLVNPFHVNRSKAMDDNLSSKNDMKDPKTIAKLVIEGRYSEVEMPNGIYANLRVTNESRLRIQEDKKAISNRIKRWIKIYFPEYDKVFCDWSKKASMKILKSIPMPEDINGKSIEEICQIWKDEKIRAVGKTRAKALLEAANKSIGRKEGIESAREELQLILEEYELKEKHYEKIMINLERQCSEIPNAKLLMEIKGIGLITVAGFISEVGEINKYESAKQIQKLAGLALKENSSGKHKGQTTISKQGRRKLRCLLFQAAMPLVSKNKEFKEIHEYYTTREKNPLKKKQSIIAISCKVIRVFYAVLSKGIKYDATKMINDIKRIPA